MTTEPTKSEILKLPVKLTREEVAERAKELAATIEEHDRIDAAKKASASEAKVELDQANARIRELSRAVKSGEEFQDVECRWEPDPVRLVMNLLRCDTGERVTSRSMTNEERQGELPGASPTN